MSNIDIYELNQTNPHVAAVANSYDNWAQRYDENAKYWQYIAAQKVAKGIVENAQRHLRHIVDLGTGTGKVIDELKSSFHDASYTGLDISSNMMLECRKKHPGTALHQCNMNDDIWPLEDESADALTCAGVISMISNLDHFFNEASRVLKPAGLLSLSFLIREEKTVGRLHGVEPFKQYPRHFEEMHDGASGAGLAIIDDQNESEFCGFRTAGYKEIYGFCVYQKPGMS